MHNPFLIEAVSTDPVYPLAALSGTRNGYLQLAPRIFSAQEAVIQYQDLSEEVAQQLFQAAHAWARILESHGAEKVYWITLAEVLTHLHIHLYPRWPEDTLKGVPLFEQREQHALQPAWTETLIQAKENWARQYQVTLISG